MHVDLTPQRPSSERSSSQQRRLTAFNAFARVVSPILILIGGWVLVGWAWNIAVFKSLIPGLATMKPNTAVAFGLAGLSLWLFQRPKPPWSQRLSWIAASGVTLIGLLTLSQYLFGWDLGIDRLLFRAAVELDSLPPGRMSVATALNFSFSGFALLLLHHRQRLASSLGQMLSLSVTVITLLSLVGYAYGVQSLYRFGFTASIALHTTLAFVLLATALLCARPDQEPLLSLTSDLAGGLMLRRLLPATLGLLFFLGWLEVLGARQGLYDNLLLTGLFVVTSLILLTFLSWRAARSLDHTDQERQRNADAQRRQAERLHNLLLLDRDILAAESLTAIAETTLARLSHIIPCQRLSIALIDWTTDTVLILASRTQDGETTPHTGRQESLDPSFIARLRAGEVLQIDDVLEMPTPVPPKIQAFQAEGVRTFVGAPLIAHGELLGTLNLLASRPRAFTTEEVEIAVEVAVQVAIAVQQARTAEQIQRHTLELEQRVVERTAALQTALTTTHALYTVARSIIAVEGLSDLLRVMVDTIIQTLSADRASLVIIDPHAHRIKQFVPGGTGATQIITSIPYEELLEGLSGWVLREKRPALSPKSPPDPRESPAVQRRRIETNCGAILVVPLCHQNEVIGTLTAINTPDQREFDEQDVKLMEAIANQAATAIAKAQLLEQVQHQLGELHRAEANLRRQNEFLSALHQITLDLIGRRDLNELFQALVGHAAQLLDAPYGEVTLVEGEALVVHAATFNQPQLIGDRATRDQAVLAWQAFDTRRPVVIEDYSAWPHRRDIYANAVLHAVADFPILNNERCFGVLALGRDKPDYVFTPEQILFGSLFAQLAALILDNAQLRENLRQQSIRDPLTGLFNRRYLEATLTREAHRATRRQRPLGIIMLDIDHFKRFNDTYGHAGGDLLLSELAHLVQRHIRGDDVPCRYGGEEFTLILPDASLEVTRQRAETLRVEAHQLHLEFDGQLLGRITLSLGVAVFPDHGQTVDAVLQAADEALYTAKRGGRNQVCVAAQA